MPSLESLLACQDQLVTRRQALCHMSPDEIAARLGPRWQVILPGVYATFTGGLSARQRLRAGLLLAGSEAALTDLTALRLHRIDYLPADDLVRILVPAQVRRNSRQFVVIRRTTRMTRTYELAGYHVVPVHRALGEFIARHGDERQSLAVAAAAIQAHRTTVDRIAAEARAGPARGRPRLLRVVDALSSGVHSLPEDDFRRLVARSRVLPEPLWNCTLILPSGRRVMPDALVEDSGVVHETNGREVHAGFQDFEDMQQRHDEMTAAGLTVLHNAPRRIREDPAGVLDEVERCHLSRLGTGMPDGVRVIATGRGSLTGPAA